MSSNISNNHVDENNFVDVSFHRVTNGILLHFLKQFRFVKRKRQRAVERMKEKRWMVERRRRHGSYPWKNRSISIRSSPSWLVCHCQSKVTLQLSIFDSLLSSLWSSCNGYNSYVIDTWYQISRSITSFFSLSLFFKLVFIRFIIIFIQRINLSVLTLLTLLIIEYLFDLLLGRYH